ncbi:uncharacterized protein LOC113139741 [Mastacembelus armatus]|uniref:uncharacterized protein LOC113139741 n=1 Tax=Mastacembelus armatus TaxID=205130 RepID=UPI000E457B7C|nr:uncharacterized protein LOC113139741 [Mastacembelus armatus]
MTDNIVINPLGLVLIFTAHMVFTRPNQTVVTGILGKNITLQFTFSNTGVRNNSHFAVYTQGEKKIAEHAKKRLGNRSGDLFNIYPHNNSVLYHITNLSLNQSGTYWAALFEDYVIKSQEVTLTVLNETRSSTVPPKLIIITTKEESGSSSVSYSDTVTVLVVSPVMLLAVLLLACLIWCLVRTSDKQQQGPQQNSNPTIQETVEVSNDVAPPSVIYSVLEFPKRPSTVLEFNPNDTEYAAVSYLPEKRSVMHS